MSEFIEARCPKCRHVKDPAQKMCGPCSLMTKVEAEQRLRARLDAIPVPVLVLIAVLLVALKFVGTILCGVVAWHYWTLGNLDLTLVWVMLGYVLIPVTPPKSPSANA